MLTRYFAMGDRVRENYIVSRVGPIRENLYILMNTVCPMYPIIRRGCIGGYRGLTPRGDPP